MDELTDKRQKLLKQQKRIQHKLYKIDSKLRVLDNVIANPTDKIIVKAYKARKTVTKCKSSQPNSCRHKWQWLRSGPSLGFGDFEYTEYKCEKCNEIKREN